MITENPNPRYWRSATCDYIVNFEKVAMIFPEAVQLSDDLVPDRSSQTVKVCIALDDSHKAFMLHTPRSEFAELMAAYEKWLTRR